MAVSVKNKISAAADKISKKANKFVSSASNTAKSYIKQNPTEARTTILGIHVGAGLGFAIGGSIGVVGFFGGVGIPWFVLLALSGGFLGNRFGLSRDKKF